MIGATLAVGQATCADKTHFVLKADMADSIFLVKFTERKGEGLISLHFANSLK